MQDVSKEQKFQAEPLLNIKEAAELLKVNPSFLYELARPGNPKLPSIKVGRYRRFRWTDLIGYFEGHPKSDPSLKPSEKPAIHSAKVSGQSLIRGNAAGGKSGKKGVLI